MAEAKKLYIKTYGCQMNVYDSDKMADVMQPVGYQLGDSIDDADMVILNTCHIREKAAEKLYSELGRIRPLKEARKQQGKEMVIAVAGCVGQAEGEEIFKRAHYVDVVVGPQSYNHLPDLVAKVHRDAKKVINLDFPEVSKFDHLPQAREQQNASAFLSIQEGCDKFCTFCVVPYTRGAEYSRPVSEVFREAITFVSQGVKDITLLGQNVNAYHGEGPDSISWSLAQLIRHLATIEGLERIRFTTSHPRDMDDDLIAAFNDTPQLMPYLHLPLQAGSDKVLREMNRKHTAADYLIIIDKLKKACPDIALSSDFIVGFPGETEEDFQATLDIVERVNYAQCYSFKYSPRPGTPGAERDDQIDEKVKKDRLERLQNLLKEKQLCFNQSCLGKIMPVLFDRIGKYDGQFIGRSPYMQSVFVTGESHIQNTIQKVKITEIRPNSLAGILV